MKYSKSLTLYKLECEKQGFEPAEILERLSKETPSGGWHLKRLDKPMNFAVLAAIVWPDQEVTCGQALTAYIARQQRQAIDGKIWAEKTLPSIKARNNVPDKPAPAPGKPRTSGSVSPSRPERSHSGFERRALLD